jgi:hypothetical protein
MWTFIRESKLLFCYLLFLDPFLLLDDVLQHDTLLHYIYNNQIISFHKRIQYEVCILVLSTSAEEP